MSIICLEQEISGWGRFPRRHSREYFPQSESQLLQLSDESVYLPRGEGRSYGDASLAAVTVNMRRFNHLLSFDPEQGIVRAEAGVTLAAVQRWGIPRGYMLAVTPGTRYVQLGGAIAADVHGKNQHREGSFADHVLSFRLITPTGDVVDVTREQTPELWHTTVGGLGLTGVISEITFRLKPVSTAWIRQHTQRASHLDELLEQMQLADRTSEYTVAWIDTRSRGGELGRGILFSGNEAEPSDLHHKFREHPLHLPRLPERTVPGFLPVLRFNGPIIQWFNTLYYHGQLTGHQLVDKYSFFYPLDQLHQWNRLYGSPGFLQYQCLLPQAESVQRMLEELTHFGQASFLAVLKRFSRNSQGWLGFPEPGYTLALDFPLSPAILPFLDQLDRLVVEQGGRVYLVKDARMHKQWLSHMYPQLDRWRSVRNSLDPQRRCTSQLASRLELCQ